MGAILGNPTQIHQVIMNLCTNAHHSMLKKGGVLELKASEGETGNLQKDARIAEVKPGKYVLLQVEGTGHGMT